LVALIDPHRTLPIAFALLFAHNVVNIRFTARSDRFVDDNQLMSRTVFPQHCTNSSMIFEITGYVDPLYHDFVMLFIKVDISSSPLHIRSKIHNLDTCTSLTQTPKHYSAPKKNWQKEKKIRVDFKTNATNPCKTVCVLRKQATSLN